MLQAELPSKDSACSSSSPCASAIRDAEPGLVLRAATCTPSPSSSAFTVLAVSPAEACAASTPVLLDSY
jgi:hypothetical protein